MATLPPFNIRVGTPMLRNLDAVDEWAAANGGELGVRRALAEGLFSLNATMPEKWLELRERERVEGHASESLEVARRSAAASEKAALYAMWSAAISAATGIVAAAAYFYAR